jgi:tetratricopeptide (TPR) repeat protein
MTVNGSRARAAAILIAWLTLSAVPAFAQDSIAEARKLYQAAYYDEALTMLDRLNDPVSGADADLAQYRVLCLLALGRNAEANVGIENILRRNPQFKPSEADTSPRIRAVFDAGRRRLLPQIFQERYDGAKAAFERKEFSVAADQFSSLATLLDDPALMGEDARSDLKVVVAGFADLSRAAAVKPWLGAVDAPSPDAAVPAPAKPAAARLQRRSGRRDPPVAI